jgi:mono/diheme cytochrome c family protein
MRPLIIGLTATAGVLLQTQNGIAETLLERGTYLMKSIVACGNCHTPKGGPLKDVEFAGGFQLGGPKAPFTAFASNITPDKATGVGAWSDDQLVRAIREGIRPDGSLIGPPMPFAQYKGLSNRDARALIAYIRQVKPVKNKVAKSVYRIPLPPAYGPKIGTIATPDPQNKVAYGGYLANALGHCMECHTPLVKGHPDFKNQLGRGGNPFPGPWGIAVSRNITPHKADGIGKWTDAQIKRAITSAVRADGTKLNPPMAFPYYKSINDADLDALVAYLRSIKPMANK